MWLAIWLCFAVFVLVFVGWTLVVLFQQKKAWKSFSTKHKLKYTPGRMMDSPTVSGVVNERPFSLYTGVQQTPDIRGQRFVTVIEFEFGKGMPTGAAIATTEFDGFIRTLIFNDVLTPDLAEWKSDYVVRARDKKNLKAYLTKERQQLLHSLFSMKNAAVLLFFDELEAVLRIETTDPLRDERHLEKIVKRVARAVETLAPSAAEKKTFKKLLADEKRRREAGDDGEDDDEEEGDEVEAEEVAEAEPPKPDDADPQDKDTK